MWLAKRAWTTGKLSYRSQSSHGLRGTYIQDLLSTVALKISPSFIGHGLVTFMVIYGGAEWSIKSHVIRLESLTTLVRKTTIIGKVST